MRYFIDSDFLPSKVAISFQMLRLWMWWIIITDAGEKLHVCKNTYLNRTKSTMGILFRIQCAALLELAAWGKYLKEMNHYV